MTKEENEMNLFRDHIFAARNSFIAAISGFVSVFIQHSIFLKLASFIFCISNGLITLRMLRANRRFGNQASNVTVQKLAVHSSFVLLVVPLFFLQRKNGAKL